ncbi:MAG TPA: histidine phosphatase family protein [Sporolactobacillaceae bacterium]|nr:histidine phosphatase family protein [Sporolactobacillaceae bacterium]
MGRLYLTRHGETIWNKEERLQGRANSPLTERGICQAEELANRLRDQPLDLIISSPSERTLQTAQIINSQHQLAIVQDEHFMEIDVAEWEGKKKAELDPEQAFLFWKQPHLYKSELGEDFYDVRERVLPRIKSILQEHPHKDILLVTHAVVLKTILSYFDDRPLERLWEGPFLHGTSLTVIDFEGDHHEIILYADTSHFSEPVTF